MNTLKHDLCLFSVFVVAGCNNQTTPEGQAVAQFLWMTLSTGFGTLQKSSGIWLMLDINISKLKNLKAVQLNISLPSKLVSRIDAYNSSHQMSRNVFFARAAEAIMNQNPSKYL